MRHLLLWFSGGILLIWSFGALWFDASPLVAWGFLLAILAAACMWGIRKSYFIPFLGFVIVLGWWLTLSPSNNRHWQEDVSRLPWAETLGNIVIFHNLRAFDYPANGKPIPAWETLSYDLNELEGMDLAMNYWGSSLIAHPIIIFRFRNAPPLAFSIETRREDMEEYSALAGLYRKYEQIVVAGGERDILRVRTNHRKGEDVYLYSTAATPEKARKRLLEYITLINSLRDNPRWYNVLTSNCTTAILSIRNEAPLPHDIRLLLNGKLDEMLYELGFLKNDGLPFETLKQRALINPVAVAVEDSQDFSQKIRESRPGFEINGSSKPRISSPPSKTLPTTPSGEITQ